MSERASRPSPTHDGRATTHAREASPGKQTQVEHAVSSMVQQRPGHDDVHAAAARGTAGPATALPFADKIQALFGPRHDVASIRAHVGGEATEAASAMGASAYATGNHAVFAGTPDLHTAAHEAAHVVQQSHGVQLYGGVGEVNDRHERHADAVADRVVAGQSAAELLDQAAPAAPATGATANSVVQRQATDVESFTWGEREISARPAEGHEIAGRAQPKVMAHLQKMLMLLTQQETEDPEGKIDQGRLEFSKAYDMDEQCFGYTEIFKQFPTWLTQVWKAITDWDAQNLQGLRVLLAGVTARRTNGDVIEEAILLMREGFEKQGGEIQDDHHLPEADTDSEEHDMTSLGQATGTMKGASDLGKRLEQAFDRIPQEVPSASLEVSSGGHSTRVAVTREPFLITAFDPDHVEAFKETQQWDQAGAFLWVGLSHRRDGAKRTTASIDIDVQVKNDDISDLGIEEDTNLLEELSDEVLQTTIRQGEPDDLLHALEYNDAAADQVAKAIEDGTLSREKFEKMMKSEGPGGKTWDEIKSDKEEDQGGDEPKWSERFSRAMKIALYKELRTKATLKQAKCAQEVARIATVKTQNGREAKRLQNRLGVFSKKQQDAGTDIARYTELLEQLGSV